jgi:hypothetical protein
MSSTRSSSLPTADKHLPSACSPLRRPPLAPERGVSLAIPIAQPEFMNCPPPLGSPRFARGTKPRSSPCEQTDKGTPLRFTACGAPAFLPSPPAPLPQDGRGDRGARRCARFFALTPSPSPTGRERCVGAHGGAPAFSVGRKLRSRSEKPTPHSPTGIVKA